MFMAASSPTPQERARKYAALIMQRLAGSQDAIAATMGVSGSTISRLKADHIDSFTAVLAHAGLKVVPVEMRCYPEDRMQAILTLARERLDQINNASEMAMDE
ncbi:MAG TPA: transcriptional regulator [Halomonas sp.]|nr:transcriptional regulator [Halomonas sp.]|tara:strand:- start:2085 stop:2393 length:309 start_codon:yes stop_codon:yes gene_type:complete